MRPPLKRAGTSKRTRSGRRVKTVPITKNPILPGFSKMGRGKSPGELMVYQGREPDAPKGSRYSSPTGQAVKKSMKRK